MFFIIYALAGAVMAALSFAVLVLVYFLNFIERVRVWCGYKPIKTFHASDFWGERR